MTQDSQKIDDAMAGLQGISADDPDMMAKLNEIAMKVAAAQGKTQSSNSNTNDIAADPMDALGCEGCQ